MADKHTPGPWHSVHELAPDLKGERWTIAHYREDGSVRYVAQTMGTHLPTLAAENAANARLISASPSLLKAACLGWDALSVLLESVESELSKKDRADAKRAIDKLFEINEELKGLLLKHEDTTNWKETDDGNDGNG